ncbi:DUF4405 domain-containing protein [Archaeoglobus profundus]|uniref:Flavinylation-associated cytochrome domain-containing protein n=1 Tax=Archaeoglobus profundus (strain DSM 5631 / JCM 9629 / NBRC 100127 / Av18) TaxID=572546 RepID=D2RHV9_ARCPA|nr:DUF4405 domain-containing protein [Archaeoglobus profundus]ADB57884.1 conserved hypothetical protein [Archaeoglobus profundus DSM 5631]
MGAKTRATIVFVLIALGLFQLISGLILYFTPGRHGYREVLVYGLEKHLWKEYHLYVGLIITAVAIIHFILNWKMFKHEIKALFK